MASKAPKKFSESHPDQFASLTKAISTAIDKKKQWRNITSYASVIEPRGLQHQSSSVIAPLKLMTRRTI